MPGGASVGGVAFLRAQPPAEYAGRTHTMTGVWAERTWSVALFGHFNPAIITTQWLIDAGVITERETCSAVSSDDMTATTIRAGDFVFEVTLERFLLQTTNEESAPRLEHVVRLVFEALLHTPIRSVAMGLDGEWSGEGQPARDRVISRLLVRAKSLEALLGPTEASSATLRFGGLTNPSATCHVTLEDSDELPNGLYLSLVDEETIDAETASRPGPAVDILRRRWGRFMRRADEVVQVLVDLS